METKIKRITESLSQFNNMSFSKKQWNIILKGCEAPKSTKFWLALRRICLQKNELQYMLIGISESTMREVWNLYCSMNRASTKKAYYKNKAKKKAQEQIKNFKRITFYMVEGVLTTEKPTFD